MGPTSKDAVLGVLGHLLAEARMQREVLSRLQARIESRLLHEAQGIQEDFRQTNRRISALESTLREHGIPHEPPTPPTAAE